LLSLAEKTDLFLFDLKLMDDEQHKQYTGVSNRPILENLSALAKAHRQIWLRIPIIRVSRRCGQSRRDCRAGRRAAGYSPGVPAALSQDRGRQVQTARLAVSAGRYRTAES